MPGIQSSLDIAKNALGVHQYAMDVTAHNIANVNTEGYSRQTVVNTANTPQIVGGHMFGRGVSIEYIDRLIDQNVEDRLMEYKADLATAEEMEKYGKILDGLFNETEGNGLGAMLSDFWNQWEDLSLNPAGTAERAVLFEQSTTLAQYMVDLDAALSNEESGLGENLESGVRAINALSDQIADLNLRIVQAEMGSVANDLRDQRGVLLSQLGEYMNVDTIEQNDGSLTVMGPKGVVLVLLSSSFDLGVDQGQVVYGPGTSRELTITDYIDKGKLGGWLEMRDGIIAEVRANLDEMAKELIFAVNQQHSQGVGVTGFSSATGSYQASDTSQAIGSSASGLDYYDRVADGQFTMWVYDSTGALVNAGGTNIAVTAAATTMDQIAVAIDGVDANIAASSVGGQLSITASNGFTFAFSPDSSNALAAMGVNSFFTGFGSSTIGVNSDIAVDRNLIAAGQVDAATGDISTGGNDNAMAVAALKYTEFSITEWTANRIGSDTSVVSSTTIEGYFQTMISTLGSELGASDRERQFAESMVQNMETLRGSISGVSLDEEMTVLIELQQAYAASSKVITTMDELFQTLLSTKS